MFAKRRQVALYSLTNSIKVFRAGRRQRLSHAVNTRRHKLDFGHSGGLAERVNQASLKGL
jgi:hypothetical protein